MNLSHIPRSSSRVVKTLLSYFEKIQHAILDVIKFNLV